MNAHVSDPIHIVGSGPNALTAAALLSQAGRDVHIYEQNTTIGGACSSADIFNNGGIVDLGAAGHPFGAISPAFNHLGITQNLWVHPTYPMAHPLENGRVALLCNTLEDTLDALAEHSPTDANAWKRLFTPLVRNATTIGQAILDPPRHGAKLLRSPAAALTFGTTGMLPASVLASTLFTNDAAHALLLGCALHAIRPPNLPGTAGIGLLFAALGESTGWPIARGGSGEITKRLATIIKNNGGHIHTNHPISNPTDPPPNNQPTLLNTTRATAQRITGHPLPTIPKAPGIYKVDYWLSEPTPWTNPATSKAGTVHLGGTPQQMITAEQTIHHGKIPTHPFIMVCQQDNTDPTRRPQHGPGTTSGTARHLWAYAHAPHGYQDPTPQHMKNLITDRIEHYAPGFKDCIVETRTTTPSDLQQWNPNLTGGDVALGTMGPTGLLHRAANLLNHNQIHPNTYLISAAAYPGAGVHGMAGAIAANHILRS